MLTKREYLFGVELRKEYPLLRQFYKKQKA